VNGGAALSTRRLRLPRSVGSVGTLGVVSAGVIAFAAAVAIFGPMLAPYDSAASRLSDAFVGPGNGHLFGFDSEGRDLLSRLLVGARTSLLGPLAVVAMSMTAATMLAVLSAWRGGWLDTVIASITNVMFAFPAILMAVLATAAFGPGLIAASLALTSAYTPFVMRTLRATALQERRRDYISALEVQGLPGLVICLRHLIPNVMPLIVAQGTILVGYAMVDLATISYIGLGVQPPQADWGVMVASGQSGLVQGYPAESLAAGGCIVAVVVAVNVLAERLSDRAEGRQA
jgi:peptide/nickel transport system permease protein